MSTATRVPTYHLRRGRMTAGRRSALDRLAPRWTVPVDGPPLHLPTLFGRAAPVVLEVGSGMGEATASLAAAEPEHDVLAVEVHTPGVAALLRRIEDGGLRNVRVVEGDALLVLRDRLATGSLAAVRVFFPDPWPKTRHAKRRLVDDAFAALVTDRLRPGGLLHVVTDCPTYARQVQAVLSRAPGLQPVLQLPSRPVSRFEARARAAGRPVHEQGARRADPGRQSW